MHASVDGWRAASPAPGCVGSDRPIPSPARCGPRRRTRRTPSTAVARHAAGLAESYGEEGVVGPRGALERSECRMTLASQPSPPIPICTSIGIDRPGTRTESERTS